MVLREKNIEQGYMGNPKLPAPGARRKFSREQIEEIYKCSKDVEYFAEKYFTIVNVDEGKQLIELYEYQKEVLKKLQNNRFNILTQSRQSGKSTIITIFICWFILFNRDKNVAILANKGKTAKMLLGRIKFAYELLPDFLKDPVVEWNKESIKLDNGCTVFSAATSSDSISGESVSLLFVDEVAKVDGWEEFWSSTYPTISSGKETRVVMVSTAKGLNHYWRLWQKAIKGESEFVPTEINWDKVPGRDEEWKKTQIANTNEDQFLQEHCNVFVGSQHTLIKMQALRELSPMDPIYQNAEGIKIYEETKDDHVYVITVDTGHGKGLDFSCFSIIDITEYPFKQVGIFRANDISPFLYPTVIYNWATKYNNAYVIVENNDLGAVVASTLNYDLEYENLLNASDTFGDPSKKYELGTRTTVRTKAIGCNSLKELIEEKKFIVNDEDTIDELTTFVAKGKSYEADQGAHDDTVATLFIFGWFSRTDFFNDVFMNRSVSEELYKKRLEKELESMPAFGFIDDGTNRPFDLEPEEEIVENNPFSYGLF
jgi:hypothetical protein